MPKITILGAGVVGMAIATQLPLDYDITIVGHYLPGDPMEPEYISQWAGAIWLGVHDCSAREKRMQLDALAALWALAGAHPESSVRRIKMREVQDYGKPDGVWYSRHVPSNRELPKSELPEGAAFGMEWETVVITPPIFLPWLRERLERRGVVFKRAWVRSLADLKGLGHDVLINATSFGSRDLLDVKEKRIQSVKQQNLRIKKPGYDRLYIRRRENGDYYSTAFSRADGTIYIGGIKTFGAHDFTVNQEHRQKIIQRAHENQPDVFPTANLEDYEVLGDHVGVYPVILQKDGGVRCERETVGGQKVVHAYGMEAGGYTFSFGLAREAAKLVSEYAYASLRAQL